MKQQFSKLDNLKVIEGHANFLLEVPILKNIENLDLVGNKIREIPDEFWENDKLKSLDLSYNELTTIPDKIEKLISIESITVMHNKITSLPATLNKLPYLRKFIANCNEITQIPDTVALSETLYYFDIGFI